MVSSSDGEDFFASSPSHNTSQPSAPSLEHKTEEVEGSASPVKKRSDLFRGDDDDEEDGDEDATLREPVVVRKRQKIERSESPRVKKASSPPPPPAAEVVEVTDESPDRNDWSRKYVSMGCDARPSCSGPYRRAESVVLLSLTCWCRSATSALRDGPSPKVATMLSKEPR